MDKFESNKINIVYTPVAILGYVLTYFGSTVIVKLHFYKISGKQWRFNNKKIL